MTTAHGPWVDVHAHPGRCFLGGLAESSPLVQMFGPDDSVNRVRSSATGEVAVVNTATVGDLAVIAPNASGGLGAGREFEPGEAVRDHDRQLAAVDTLLAHHDIRTVLAPDDIHAAAADGTPGAFVSCEGGDFLDGGVDGLERAYERGVRSITLVHYRINELGDIQTEAPRHDGLTPFGKEVVAEMNSLGMIVDLAHATFDVTVDALEISTAPILISHSHLAAPGADHPRLLSEEHARMVAEAGGVIGAWPSGMALASLADYCDEICRMVDVVGVDHVAIGTDLDANYRPVLTDYEQFPQVAAGLVARGLHADEVDQVLGGNFIRLFEQTVAVAGA